MEIFGLHAVCRNRTGLVGWISRPPVRSSSSHQPSPPDSGETALDIHIRGIYFLSSRKANICSNIEHLKKEFPSGEENRPTIS
jgi:hypothetical protein